MAVAMLMVAPLVLVVVPLVQLRPLPVGQPVPPLPLPVLQVARREVRELAETQ